MLAIYTRISKDRKDQVSTDNQAERGKALAKVLNIGYKIYEDKGISGTSDIRDRPSLFSLLQDIDAGLVTKVYCYDQSRLERQPAVRFVLLDKFAKYDIDLYYESGKVEDDPETKLVGGINSIVNNYFVDITKLKIKMALSSNAEKGKVHAIPPFGYHRDDNSMYAIDDEYSQVVKDIYKLSLDGVGTSKIAEVLNDKKIPTKYNLIGKGTISTTNINHKLKKITVRDKTDVRWSGSSVRNIIKNKFYAGVRLFNGVEYEVPMIIDLTYWHKVNDNLQKNRNNSGKVVTHKYLLKGLLSCGRCGRNYYGRSRVSKKDNAYICSSRRYKNLNCNNRGINIDKLDEIIWLKFIADGKLGKLIKQHYENINTNEIENDIEAEIKALEVVLKTLVSERSSIINSISKGIITDLEAKSQMTSLRINIESNQSALDTKQEQLSHLRSNTNSLVDALDGLNFNPSDVSFLDKQSILNKYLNNIIIYYDNDNSYFIEIQFNIPLMKNSVFTVDRNYKIAYEVIDMNGKDIQDVTLIILDEKLDNTLKKAKEIDISLMVNSKEKFEELKSEYRKNN
jgi:DNA invertase Pin-like site-specific DNA recombinase